MRTTFARSLPGRHADAVAMQAGRIMLMRLKELTAAKQDFAFESTLSSRSFAPFLRQLQAQGCQVAIYYFSLTSASLAVRRVKLRVAMGGHDVPEEIVRRRYVRSLINFHSLYMPLADRWAVFDNSVAAGPNGSPRKKATICKSRNPSHGSSCKSS